MSHDAVTAILRSSGRGWRTLAAMSKRSLWRRTRAVADPAPNAEEWLAMIEEERERDRWLSGRLASLTPDEHAAIRALTVGEPARDGDAERRALAKLLVAPGERATEVLVLVGGRRRRLRRPAVLQGGG